MSVRPPVGRQKSIGLTASGFGLLQVQAGAIAVGLFWRIHIPKEREPNHRFGLVKQGVTRKPAGLESKIPSHKVVPGHGNPHADVMFIGEAPGREEDECGLPFVGPAGKELDETYVERGLGLKRNDVFVTNCVRVRPVSETLPPKDRRPRAAELKRWLPDLRRDIAMVRPSVIVLLGTTAAKHLLRTRLGVTRLRGAFHEYDGIRVMPTFHPAYLRRNRSKRREVLADMMKVRALLHRL